MKNFLLVCLLLFLYVPCAARRQEDETCNLTLEDAPSFFGLKLEMTPAQVKSVFGKSLKLKIKKEGSFFQNFIDKPPPSFLPEVRALYLRFFDYKLYQIEIFYENKNKKQTAAEFVNILSSDLHLSEKLWKNTYGKFQLNCAGFSLVADKVLNPRIELTDEAARARFEESQRRKKNL